VRDDSGDDVVGSARCDLAKTSLGDADCHGRVFPIRNRHVLRTVLAWYCHNREIEVVKGEGTPKDVKTKCQGSDPHR
jgi:hypothetical protein